MSLNDTLMQDMKTAMKAKDKEALTTIRSLKAAVMNYKIKVGHDLTSDDELTVLSSALKQRKESLEEFSTRSFFYINNVYAYEQLRILTFS